MSGTDSKYQLGGTIRHTVNDYTQFTPNDNIKIFVRAKPVLELTELNDSPRIPGIMKPAEEDPDRMLIMRHPEQTRIVEDKFCFNRVFLGDCTQEDIFNEVGKPLINKVLEGYNGCMFSYGQTGAGKTHTMFGDNSPELAGLIPRTAEYIFRAVDETKNEVAVGCSFLEIYNERIRDIAALFSAGADTALEPPDATVSLDHMFAQVQEGVVTDSASFRNMKAKYNAMNLDVLQTRSGIAVVKNLTILKVSSVEAIMKMLSCGLLLRETHATHMNANSSRSHTVFTIRVIQRNKVSGVSVSSELHVIDLAGSERLDDSKSSGMRLKEEIFINSSLTVLGKVISSLDPNLKQKKHIPYRESKLTRILRNSLSGNCYTSVIANINPQDQWYAECISTLEFVSRCRNVTSNPRINYFNSTQEAADQWAGLGTFAPLAEPVPEEAAEPEHRLMASGSKVFWRANAAVDFYLYEHINNDSVELIGYNAGLFLEFRHIYLAKSTLYTAIEAEAKKRYETQHEILNITKPSTSLRNSKSLESLQELTSAMGRSKSDLKITADVPVLELSQVMDAVAGEYVIDHMVYISGTSDHPPRVVFFDELENEEESFQISPPALFLPISRPLNKRDKALLEAREHGKTSEEINRLKEQATGYLSRAATLLDFNLDAKMKDLDIAKTPSQRLKGMMDQEYTGDTGEDAEWAVPKRRIKLSPVPSVPSDDGTHLPQISEKRKVVLHLNTNTSPDKVPTNSAKGLPLLSPSASTPSVKLRFFSTDSGPIKKSDDLLNVFKYFASEKYNHEEMDAFGFKKLCRELHVTNGKFTTGAAEAAFRKITATGGAADDNNTVRIRFETLPSVLRVVAKERPCLYDQLVDVIVHNFEALSSSPSPVKATTP